MQSSASKIIATRTLAFRVALSATAAITQRHPPAHHGTQPLPTVSLPQTLPATIPQTTASATGSSGADGLRRVRLGGLLCMVNQVDGANA